MFNPDGLSPGSETTSWFAGLDRNSGFIADPRFGAPGARPSHAFHEPEAGARALEERIAAAFEEGRAKGLAEAEQDAATQVTERRRLGSAIRRMDEDMTNRLAQQLSATVSALCEATLAPMAIDIGQLQRRCERAAGLLAESREDCVLHLHPDDIARLDDEFAQEWRIKADPALAPGNLRLEGAEGGMSDGPDEWRQILAEALTAC